MSNLKLNGFETMDDIKEIQMDDLKEIGVYLLGHRTRIIKEISRLRTNRYQQSKGEY